MKKRVALVLGSGGARGYAHIGVIEEIEKRGYEIACIAGCSMGAVVGGIYAAGKLQDYRNWIESLDYLDVLRLVDVSFRLGAIRGEKVFGQIRKIVGEINIEDQGSWICRYCSYGKNPLTGDSTCLNYIE